MAPTSREAAFCSARCWQWHHIPKAWLKPSKTKKKKKKRDNNKICAIYLLEQSGVGNFSCVKYRAKFVFLHSSLAKMPCGGRVDKLTVCQTNRAFFHGEPAWDKERLTSSIFILNTVQMFVKCPVCKDDKLYLLGLLISVCPWYHSASLFHALISL